jgi:hypothetical protein
MPATCSRKFMRAAIAGMARSYNLIVALSPLAKAFRDTLFRRTSTIRRSGFSRTSGSTWQMSGFIRTYGCERSTVTAGKSRASPACR